MTKQDISRRPEEYIIEIKVCGAIVALDVREILFLKIERWPEPCSPWIRLHIEAKCNGTNFECDGEIRHLIRVSKEDATDALLKILEKADALNWDEKRECLHLSIK